MKIHDISLTIRNGMPVWPGDDEVNLKRFSQIEKGESVNISSLSLCVHTGTHVDAPYHFIQDGMKADELPLDILIGPVQLIQIPEEETEIDAQVLAGVKFEPGVKRVLFKTSNSSRWKKNEAEFQTEFVAISEDGAEFLLKQGIQLVGIDYLSISPFTKSIPTHMAFLSAKVVVIEGLDLRGVNPGIYTLYCLPLKLSGSDGAPARAVLIQE